MSNREITDADRLFCESIGEHPGLTCEEYDRKMAGCARDIRRSPNMQIMTEAELAKQAHERYSK